MGTATIIICEEMPRALVRLRLCGVVGGLDVRRNRICCKICKTYIIKLSCPPRIFGGFDVGDATREAREDAGSPCPRPKLISGVAHVPSSLVVLFI